MRRDEGRGSDYYFEQIKDQGGEERIVVYRRPHVGEEATCQ